MKLSLPWRRTRPEGKSASTYVPQNTKAAYGASGFTLHSPGQARWSPQNYTALAREGYTRNPIVFRAIRLVAETASAVPWLLYDGREERTEHPLLSLIKQPNSAEAGATFFESLFGYLLIAGNVFIQVNNTPGIGPSLHLLRPDRMSVIAGDDGWADGFEYSAGSQKRVLTPLSKDISNGVIHLKMFHPLDDLSGFAPLCAAQMALETHNATASWNKALLDNSARPSGALIYAPADGGNLTEDQYERLKTELEDGYSGATRAGRPLLLEGGLDWKPMSLTPKDMDFLEAKHSAAREIALAFGVPPMLLGIPGDNTYSNYAEANRAFYRMTVLPLINRLSGELTAALAPHFGEGLRLEHDTDRIEGLSHERDLLWARLTAATFLTDDEKREALGYGERKTPFKKQGKTQHV
jgi:HK97 family phage portal protein